MFWCQSVFYTHNYTTKLQAKLLEDEFVLFRNPEAKPSAVVPDHQQ
jgi:hypothetical protein